MRLSNAKQKGNRCEHRTIALLESAGYRCTRSGASLGVFDVIGINSTSVVLVQVKSNRWPDSAELAAIRAFPAPPNATKLIHRWRDYQKIPDVKEV